MRLRPLALRFILAAAIGIIASPQAEADLDSKYDPSKIKIPDLGAINIETPERYVTDNGIVVFLLENHNLPLVRGTAYFQGSSTWDPADKVGLAGLTGRIMRSGGSAEHDGDYLDDRLAAIGATVNTSIGSNFASGSFRCLTENTAEVVGLMAEVFRNPQFPEEKIEIAKIAARRAIAARNDELIPLLQRVASQAIFGKDSPYARTTEYATIEAIGRDDMVAIHQLVFVPNRMIIAIYGDFDSQTMKDLLNTSMGGWAQGTEAVPEMPPMPEPQSNRVVFAPKDDVTNSAIVMGHLGYKKDAPDAADMEVLGTLLGGGFQSRLFNIIRTQRGLAYATGATDGSGFFRPGVFLAYSLTRSDSTMVALDLLKENVILVTNEEATEEEADVARNSSLNSFVFNFANPSDVLFRAALYELAGYPSDFLEQYQNSLKEVTPASMLTAAQAHIHPDQLITVIVGKEDEFDRSIESIGLPVDRVDVTIPPPPSKGVAEAVTPAALALGAEWATSAASSVGGSEAWSSVKAIQLDFEATLSMQGASMGISGSTSWEFPTRRVDTIKLPTGEMIQGSDGTTGWQIAGGQTQEQPGRVAEIQENFDRSLFNLFGNLDNLQIQALSEPQVVDGVSYSVAYVQSETVTDWYLFFDGDGNLARMEFQGTGPAGPAKQTMIYRDWRSVGDIQWPHNRVILMDDEPFMDRKTTDFIVNPALSADVFVNPAS